MPYDFKVDPDRHVLVVRYTGVVTIAERRAAAEHILGQVGDDIRRVLLDYRRATSLSTDDASGAALADFLSSVFGPRGARVAWLVTYDHQLDPVVEAKSRELGIASERFHDRDAAMTWLMQPDRVEEAASPAAPSGQGATPFGIGFGAAPANGHAHGTFEVKVAPQSPDNPPAQAAALARLSLDKRYSGPLEAIGQGEMLADGGGASRHGAYVALERVTGTLHGRAGSFALVHRALMRDGTPEGWSVVVVPGSGTGALAGIDGTLRITIEHGTHFYDFEYTLPA